MTAWRRDSGNPELWRGYGDSNHNGKVLLMDRLLAVAAVDGAAASFSFPMEGSVFADLDRLLLEKVAVVVIEVITAIYLGQRAATDQIHHLLIPQLQ